MVLIESTSNFYSSSSREFRHNNSFTGGGGGGGGGGIFGAEEDFGYLHPTFAFLAKKVHKNGDPNSEAEKWLANKYLGNNTDYGMSNGDNSELIVGDTVYVNGEGDFRGKICYLGEVDFARGEWAGVVLDHPVGTHDGRATPRGRRYFQCAPNHGIFVRMRNLSRKMLIPETFNAERIGLLRNNSSSDPHGNRSSSSRSRSNSPVVSDYYVRRQMSSSEQQQQVARQQTSASFDSSYGRRSQSPTPKSVRFSPARDNSRENTPSPLRIGERVIVLSSVGECKTGILRYLGNVDFQPGEWAGVELFYPLGKNDGTVLGREYFRCEHPFGLFVPSHKVESSPANKTMQRRMGTKENLDKVVRGYRAGSYDDYY